MLSSLLWNGRSTVWKMKSREGNVVDGDELMEKMFRISKSISSELGKIDIFLKMA